MTKEEFQDLLKRYTSGKASQREIEQIDRWFASISSEAPELEEWEKSVMHEKILSTLRTNLPSGKRDRNRSNDSFLYLKVAAGLLALMLVTYLVFYRSFTADSDAWAFASSSPEEIRHKNSTQQVLVIRLPDSSSVTLKPNAEIVYEREWPRNSREVKLVGEAFFDVTKDPKRPFYVYGGDIVTKVLGTSFSVNAERDARSIQVAVRTGKVSVYEDKGGNPQSSETVDAGGVVLTPNEKVEYFVNDKHWVTSLVEEPKPAPTINKAVEFVFSNTQLKDIIQIVERAYAIDIVVEDGAMDACMFTGDVSAMELYDMLNVICKTTGNNYEVKGTKILITGKGCD